MRGLAAWRLCDFFQQPWPIGVAKVDTDLELLGVGVEQQVGLNVGVVESAVYTGFAAPADATV